MDRFEFGVIPDLQECRIMYYCCVSGDEIYEGNSYIEAKNGEIIKDELEILIEFINGNRKYAGDEEMNG